MTWSAVTFTTKIWGMVSRQSASADGGVDFEYRLHETYPWLLSEAAPLRITSTLSEGAP